MDIINFFKLKEESGKDYYLKFDNENNRIYLMNSIGAIFMFQEGSYFPDYCLTENYIEEDEVKRLENLIEECTYYV